MEPGHIPILLPRDRKQVANTQAAEKRRKTLFSDDIVGLYLPNGELPNFIQKMTLLLEFTAVLCESLS